MNESKTSVFSNGLIWFGAAVSIAEIITGTFMAPLGFKTGIMAILLGHLIGCVLLYLAGIIGGQTGRSAMETVKLSFGEKGSLIFSSLNVLQLVGWTAVMIVSGAAAANTIFSFGSQNVWSIIIGLLIILWVMVGLKNLSKINMIAMGALFIVTLVLSFVVFRGNASSIITGDMTFGAAVELSVAMPLSWLPLISDYTRVAEKPKKATFASVGVYFIVSSWMYIIGLGATIFTGNSDVAKIMVSSGLGVMGLIIVILSTVTTTYLDVYSAAVSSESIYKGFKEKPVGVAVAIVGVLLAMFTPITKFEDFLYLIGSVFAPMIAILITDFFILKKNNSKKGIDMTNVCIWIVGFIIYRVFMQVDTFVGSTFPVMIVISLLCIVVNMVGKKLTK
ncbi:putative hydroxymethylpyrimidine transporter CytX [Hathewaya proteolytica DSM 3090]|uniref:Putative hydroxymethylpyrimidine transporter CytX n=1 Tax=Hathewaya proteolytica DSM 3090 TaxID=1121331 RepID=A0A1M6JP34_9CLOT|nr:putative hydroxymethylpyrimidine transporter CytX [Hathewaya proteolytica]SHJ48471.1 putative hydroxymethylpyrimidine transporter CytX [Hathewaya proteolytica DSM 3090]